jgi:hypothetical protein
MARTRHVFVLLTAIVVLALTAAACDSSDDGSATTTATSTDEAGTAPSSTTTTIPPASSIPPESVPGTASGSIPADVEAQMRSDIGVIILDVEESRGLPFIAVPTVTILDEAEFTERVNALLRNELDPEEVAGQGAMLELLGMLEPDADYFDLLVTLFTEQVAGFYDGDAKEMVVPVTVDGITPLQEIVIAHELVHALTDQHFEFNAELERLVDVGVGDDASAYQALIEGDASYQQFLYLESFDPAKAAEAALEALNTDRSVLESVPRWLQRDLSFPYEQGLTFTGFLMDQSGLKGVDEAYQEPPITTEQILDPNKFVRNEGPLPLEPLTVDLAGWELFDEATLGQWGIQLLLLETLTPGALSQAAQGWGNDTYRVFLNGDETAFAWSYLAESIEDAEDLANGLVAHARDTMGAGGAEESGGGLLFASGSPWVFIDRIDDRIYFVAATDSTAGEDLRSQLGL